MRINKNIMKVRNNIIGFLQALNEKNYSAANKYLKSVVNEKLKVKVAHAIKTEKLF